MVEKTLICLALLIFCCGIDDVHPETRNKDKRALFDIYWNIPTFQCARYNLGFEELAQKYGILQNQNDQFLGDKISLLYDPGVFPAIVKSESGIGTVFRNGGVPQEGNLTLHLDTFAKELDKSIPDREFNGLGVIDFESWRPIYRQNFGTLQPYKDLSEDIERRKHPFWTSAAIKAEAKRRFEKSGREYMEQTLKLSKNLRPNASWAYYTFPYCFNYKQTSCPPEVLPENDQLKWLFVSSDNLHPSIYLRAEDSAEKRMQSIFGRVQESRRVLSSITDGKKRGILPYYTLQYPDNAQFLPESDISNSLDLLKTLQVDGLIIWGSSNHVNTKTKCEALYNYIDTVFGPALNR